MSRSPIPSARAISKSLTALGCLLLILIPFEWLFSIRLARLSLCGWLVILWFAAWTLKKFREHTWGEAVNPLNLRLLLFFLALLVSARSEGDSMVTLQTLLLWTEYAAVFIVAGDLSGDKSFRNGILVAMVVGGFLSAAGGIWDFATYLAAHRGWFYRARFSFYSPNLLGDHLLLALPLALIGTARPGGKSAKILWGAAFLLPVVTLALTFSRGCWVGFLAGLLLLTVLRRGHRKLLWLILSAFAALLLGAALFLPEEAYRRIGFVAVTPDLFARIRLAVWASSLRMLKDYPVFGIGLGRFALVYPAYALPGPGSHYLFIPHAHQLFLQFAVECGLLGLAALVWLLVGIIRSGWRASTLLELRADRELAAGVLAALVGLLVHGFFDYTLWYPKVGFPFWMVAGICAGLGSRVGGRKVRSVPPEKPGPEASLANKS